MYLRSVTLDKMDIQQKVLGDLAGVFQALEVKGQVYICQNVALHAEKVDLPLPEPIRLQAVLDRLMGGDLPLPAVSDNAWESFNPDFPVPPLLLRGNLSQALVESLVAGEQRGGENPLRRNLLNVAVELLQNVVLHGSPASKSAKPGVFALAVEEEAFVLMSGNVIQDGEQAALQKRLERLSGCSEEELEDLYDEVLLSEDEEEGGAGLGLIDMRMRSGEDFAWSFDRLANGTLFFAIAVTLNRREL